VRNEVIRATSQKVGICASIDSIDHCHQDFVPKIARSEKVKMGGQ
jgi:hypothetical protein